MPFTESLVRSEGRSLPPSRCLQNESTATLSHCGHRFNGRTVQPLRTMRPAGEPSGATVICGLPIVKISYER